MPAPTSSVPISPFPDIERVAEETSGREANIMLRDGWLLLHVIAVSDASVGGCYPCYVLGKPRASANTSVLKTELSQAPAK